MSSRSGFIRDRPYRVVLLETRCYDAMQRVSDKQGRETDETRAISVYSDVLETDAVER